MRKKLKTEFDLYVINKVRQKRMELGLSQEDLASFIDTHRSFIGLVESPNTTKKYNFNHINVFAQEMQCSPKDFLPDNSIVEATKKKAARKS